MCDTLFAHLGQKMIGLGEGAKQTARGVRASFGGGVRVVKERGSIGRLGKQVKRVCVAGLWGGDRL